MCVIPAIILYLKKKNLVSVVSTLLEEISIFPAMWLVPQCSFPVSNLCFLGSAGHSAHSANGQDGWALGLMPGAQPTAWSPVWSIFYVFCFVVLMFLKSYYVWALLAQGISKIAPLSTIHQVQVSIWLQYFLGFNTSLLPASSASPGGMLWP